MTTHYIDIRVVPDTETNAPQLLSALFDKLHLAFVQQQVDAIGVSFPGYTNNPRSLGVILRLHGTTAALESFMQQDWLKGVRDHVRMTDIALVPAGARHRSVQRRQFKTSAARLRRRRMRRKGETVEQATAAIPASVERKPTLPYLRVRSHSTGQPFCLFIANGPLTAQAVPGVFNRYGLSGTATIPWF